MSLLDILKVKDEQGVWHTIPALKGDKGDQGNSIESFVFSDDGTITVTFTDETTETFTGLKAALESVGNLISEVEEAELVRIANENTRKNNETSRVSAESSRVTTEAGRVSAETSRQNNETSRQNAEASRASAETARASAESARATAESGRATAESGRVSAEAGRVSAEAGRVSAEAERAAEFATWEATIAAKADQADLDAEVTRATAAETQQSQHIASLKTNKADKATEDARYAKQQTEIQFLLDAAKGQIAEVHTDSTEAYSKAVPTYTSAQAKFADVKKIGGKSVVWNQLGNDFDHIESSRYAFTLGTKFVAGNKYLLYLSLLDATASTSIAIFCKKNGSNVRVFTNNITKNKNIQTADYDALSDGTNATNENNIWYGNISYIAIGDSCTIVDLTQMYGAGNEPSTTDDPRIAAIEAYLADHPEYNAGEIISADCDAVNSTGFNLWDEEWEAGGLSTFDGSPIVSQSSIRSKNYNRCEPNSSIYGKYSNSDTNNLICFYDIAKNFISYSTSITNTILTTPQNAYYFKIRKGSTSIPYTTYNNDICINVSQPDTTKNPHNGQYLPYMTTQLSIPAGLRSAHPLRSAGSVYDEYNVARKYTKVAVGYIHGEFVNYNRSTSYANPFFFVNSVNGKENTLRYICSKYNPDHINGTSALFGNNAADKSFRISSAGNQLFIRDDDYTDAAAFKAAMLAEDVHFYYELATPIYYYDPTSPELAVNGGTVVPDATHIVDPESYFPDDTYIPVEDGGSLTFHQTGSEFPVPNTEDFYYVLEGATT